MPTTAPVASNSGPPELPGLTAASVWMNGTTASPGSERPLALTMPCVAVCSKPNGAPMASTGSPTCSCFGSPRRTDGQVLGVDAQHGDVGRRVGAEHLGRVLAAVAELDGDVLGLAHDVRVGQDQAVAADDEARALAAERHAAVGRAAAAAASGTPPWKPGRPRKNWKNGSFSMPGGRPPPPPSADLVRALHGDADHGRAGLLDDGAVVRHRRRRHRRRPARSGPAAAPAGRPAQSAPRGPRRRPPARRPRRAARRA